MSTLVYMKLLEQTPEKYDRGMRMLTLGRIDRIKREIAARWTHPGQEVLEIGCGTGSLAALLSQRGCRVVGIDVSDPMLVYARTIAPDAEFIHMTATEIEQLAPRKFDRIVSTLCFSELSEDERDFVLRAARELLGEDGQLVLADELVPTTWWKRVGVGLVRWPLAALTFLLTQNTTRALKAFEPRLHAAGYRLVSREDFLLGTLGLFVAEMA